MIPPKAALAIGLHPSRATLFRETLTASGKEFIPMVLIPKIRVFEKTFHRMTVACHELPPESPIDGLLGLDLLTRMKAVLNLNNLSIFIS